MRFALVVEPSRSDIDGRLGPFRERVMRAGFNAVRLHAGAALTRDLSRAIEVTERGDAALVYVPGDVVIGVDGAVALEGETRISLAQIADIVASRPLAQVLFVVDARCEGEPGDALRAAEHVEAIVLAIKPKERGAELLAAVEVGPRDHGQALALSRFFAEAIGDIAILREDGTATMSAAYAKMREHPEFARAVPSFAHVKGPTDFLVVAPIAERVSEPPPSRISLAPPSLRSPRKSIHPMPAIEPILADAERAHAKERWDEALEGYKKALMILGDGQPSAMASLYANIGDVKLAQGRTREAEASYEKALAEMPTHARSLQRLAKIAEEAKEWARAASIERRLARTKTKDDEKLEALLRVAARYANDARDAGKAAEVLEEARSVKPDDRRILEASRIVSEALKDWRKLASVLGAIADAQPLLHDRAQRRFEQADVLLGRLRDEPAGLAALEAVLADDPEHEKALAALVAVRARRQEWRALEGTYVRLAQVFVVREDPGRAWEIVKRLAQLRRDKLHDGPGALEAFTAALAVKPRDVETRAALAELLVAKGDRDAAIAELETCARHEPTRVATHRRLYELHRRHGATDRAWLAATALEELGGGTVDSQVLVDQFRGEARPTAALDRASWELLRGPGHDDVIARVLAAVAPFAAAHRVAQLRAEKRLALLDVSRRLSPDGTATIVRTFAWAAQVLGVEPPELYSADETRESQAGAFALVAVQSASPATLLGPRVTSGRKMPELAFLAARHLVYYRPEHYALVFFPTLPELTALFLAALKLARPELPIPTHASAAASALRKELAAHATEAQRRAIGAAVADLDARGGKLDLATWARGVEITATRAGMLLAGDLAVALAAIKGEPRQGDAATMGVLGEEERRADLLAFTASRALADLRAKLGLAARPSLPPPGP
jgi:tetratricopeptide (TPR) repeat protein